jgi:6-phosphogluconolactonase
VSGEPRVEIFDDPEATSHAAAVEIAAALRRAAEERGRADWATTGGSTPIGIYRELAAPPHADEIPWNQVHVWWGDDRFVPRDHPLSNVLAFDQVLLSTAAVAGLSGAGADAVEVDLGIEPGIRIPIDNIHAPAMSRAIRLSLGPESVAAEYDADLHVAGLPLSDSGFPILDVVLVGIGGDGHVLSAFPGSAMFDSEAWVSAIPAPTHIEPHVARVSLHPQILRAARLPIVVAHGEGKAAILATVFGSERDERKWPAQVALRDGAVWLLDRAAAASLPPWLLTSTRT